MAEPMMPEAEGADALALRAKWRELYEDDYEAHVSGCRRHLHNNHSYFVGRAAAADEVDRLRLSDSNATQQRDQLANALRRSDNENDRLRAAIEKAPHGDRCRANGWYDRGTSAFQVGPCNCWKAAAQ